MRSLFSVFTLFYFILKNMSTVKLRYLTLATSCIEPLELDKLFGVYWCIYRVIHKEWDFRDDLYGLRAVYFHMFNQEQHKFRKKKHNFKTLRFWGTLYKNKICFWWKLEENPTWISEINCKLNILTLHFENAYVMCILAVKNFHLN